MTGEHGVGIGPLSKILAVKWQNWNGNHAKFYFFFFFNFNKCLCHNTLTENGRISCKVPPALLHKFEYLHLRWLSNLFWCFSFLIQTYYTDLQNHPNSILLGSFYKYGTYKCCRPHFRDCMVRITIWKLRENFQFFNFSPNRK